LPASAAAAIRRHAESILRRTAAAAAPLVLALDWSGDRETLLIGRDPGCDIPLQEDTVSRRHARLLFRDGTWIVQDLRSTNGTFVNGTDVGRCQLRPGDRLQLGQQLIDID
jgi:pSer/pThr/pTyr-binding forkhead associated (FHA) protein